MRNARSLQRVAKSVSTGKMKSNDYVLIVKRNGEVIKNDNWTVIFETSNEDADLEAMIVLGFRLRRWARVAQESKKRSK